jgi:hypothetical protein
MSDNWRGLAYRALFSWYKLACVWTYHSSVNRLVWSEHIRVIATAIVILHLVASRRNRIFFPGGCLKRLDNEREAF